MGYKIYDSRLTKSLAISRLILPIQEYRKQALEKDIILKNNHGLSEMIP